MRIIVPQTIQLLYSNVIDESYPGWSNTNTYNQGDKVIYNYKIYESLIANNVGYQPDVSPTQWSDLGYINSRRMFDEYTNTYTSHSQNIEIEISSNKCDTIALYNVTAQNVSIIVNSNGATYFSKTYYLYDSQSWGWIDYYCGDKKNKTKVICKIPIMMQSNTRIVVDNNNFYTQIGVLIAGKSVYIGTSLYAPKITMQDFSRKNTDTFGRTSLVPGFFTQEISCDIFLPTPDIDRINNILPALRAKPVFFDFNNNTAFESLIVYGWIDAYEVIVKDNFKALLNINMKGLI